MKFKMLNNCYNIFIENSDKSKQYVNNLSFMQPEGYCNNIKTFNKSNQYKNNNADSRKSKEFINNIQLKEDINNGNIIDYDKPKEYINSSIDSTKSKGFISNEDTNNIKPKENIINIIVSKKSKEYMDNIESSIKSIQRMNSTTDSDNNIDSRKSKELINNIKAKEHIYNVYSAKSKEFMNNVESKEHINHIESSIKSIQHMNNNIDSKKSKEFVNNDEGSIKSMQHMNSNIYSDKIKQYMDNRKVKEHINNVYSSKPKEYINSIKSEYINNMENSKKSKADVNSIIDSAKAKECTNNIKLTEYINNIDCKKSKQCIDYINAEILNRNTLEYQNSIEPINTINQLKNNNTLNGNIKEITKNATSCFVEEKNKKKQYSKMKLFLKRFINKKLLLLKENKRLNDLESMDTSSTIITENKCISSNSCSFTDVCYTPRYILNNFSYQLSEYEKKEILRYKIIFYWGSEYREKLNANIMYNINKNMFNDQCGRYKIRIGDHIQYRYKIIKIVGTGSFGVTVKAYDYKAREIVAIKILRKNQSYTSVKNEKNILKYMKNNRNNNNCMYCIHAKSFFKFRRHYCIVFDFMDTDLLKYLISDYCNGIPDNILKIICKQILYGIEYIHKLKIIHSDLKPSNILINNDLKVKIADFGNSNIQGKKNVSYIQTRYYRAPEVILRLNYDTYIDIWSLGCVVAELYAGKPLFMGENEVRQFTKIIEICGLPPYKMLHNSPKKNVFYDVIQSIKDYIVVDVYSLQQIKHNLQSFLCTDNIHLVDFIASCLQWEPQSRLTINAALNHPWILNAI